MTAYLSFSIDSTSDNLKLNKLKYFEQVKSTMDKNKDTNTNDKKDVNKTNRKKISIGYFSYIKIIVVLGIVILIIYGISLILKRKLNI